jgi:predicted RNA-binding protein associated with RNAse of E/G family
VEVKEALLGEARRFDLECWLASPDLVVARWVAEAGNGFGVPAGTFSWGVWWSRRPIGAYRMHTPAGELRRYRVDAIEELRIGEGEVRYRDLLLDAWIAPDGEVTFEDEDEVAEAIEAGRLSREQRWRIDWVRGVLESRADDVRAWVDRAIEKAVVERRTVI